MIHRWQFTRPRASRRPDAKSFCHDKVLS
jgi:hypothetical protein